MTFAPYANKGIVDLSQFKRVKRGDWMYWSAFNNRMYDLKLVQKEDGKHYWSCNCPAARHINHPHGEQCKHEIALAHMLKSRHEQKCRVQIEAEQVAAEAQGRAEQSELAALRAEVADLRKMHEILRENWRGSVKNSADCGNQQDMLIYSLQSQLAEIRAENEQIKKQLATKATARKKHQSEQEAADIKRDMNMLAEDVIEAANCTIQTVSMWKERLADLEAIPHSLKAELDQWTEAGKEELQPSYKPDDHNAPEIKAEVRAMQEQTRARREASAEERREMAPLNGNQGFSVLK